VAEDNEINQMVAADHLGMFGYRVDLARNGIEAVKLATAKSYQAILMDCQMPKMDGYTATTQLRQHEHPGQHVPIIAMTAGALAEDKQRCLAACMDDYLSKPIDPEQLRAALNRWAGTAPPRRSEPDNGLALAGNSCSLTGGSALNPRHEHFPVSWREDQRRAVRIFAVADCHDAGQVPGDFDACTAVVAVGALAPDGAGKVCFFGVHAAPPWV
jgi:CheY-like chemotaxis protein